MARVTKIIDDLDGSEGADTISYVFDGEEYEIDLSKQNAEKFRGALAEYIKASRRVEAPPPATVSISRSSARRRSSSSKRDDFAEIRAWAAEQGKTVAPRGRIKKSILEEYDEAHS